MRILVGSLVLLGLFTGCDVAACPPGAVVDSHGACVAVDAGNRGDSCVELRSFWMDLDGDGAGSGAPFEACDAPGAATIGGDCAPEDPARHPGAAEVCDGEDQDCDGSTDEGTRTTFYSDADGDGEGWTESAVELCRAPDHYITTPGDCDDNCSVCTSHGIEVCDGHDNDCDGTTDEGLLIRAYEDCDGDGFAAADARFVDVCTVPTSRGHCPTSVPEHPWATVAPGPGTTDCYDLSNLASPTSTYASADSYPRADGERSWDWNCDGVETPTITATSGPTTCTAVSRPPVILCEATGSYWVSSVPACGESQTLNACSLSTPCAEVRSTVAQLCR